EDRDAGAREVAVDGRDDRVKAAEERAGGEHVREPIHAAGGILRGRYIAGFVVLGAHGMGARSWTHDIVRRAARTTDAADRVRSQVESPPCSFVPALADRGRACFSRPPAGSAARRAARAGTRGGCLFRGQVRRTGMVRGDGAEAEAAAERSQRAPGTAASRALRGTAA